MAEWPCSKCNVNDWYTGTYMTKTDYEVEVKIDMCD